MCWTAKTWTHRSKASKSKVCHVTRLHKDHSSVNSVHFLALMVLVVQRKTNKLHLCCQPRYSQVKKPNLILLNISSMGQRKMRGTLIELVFPELQQRCAVCYLFTVKVDTSLKRAICNLHRPAKSPTMKIDYHTCGCHYLKQQTEL